MLTTKEHILDSIKKEYQRLIELIYLISEKLVIVLRHIILKETNKEGKRVFVSVDSKLYRSKTNFSFTKI